MQVFAKVRFRGAAPCDTLPQRELNQSIEIAEHYNVKLKEGTHGWSMLDYTCLNTAY